MAAPSAHPRGAGGLWQPTYTWAQEGAGLALGPSGASGPLTARPAARCLGPSAPLTGAVSQATNGMQAGQAVPARPPYRSSAAAAARLLPARRATAPAGPPRPYGGGGRG